MRDFLIKKCIVFLLTLNIVTKCQETRPEVSTKYGKVKGIQMKSVHDRTFSVFMSIPYAKPPVGELRFKGPVEMEIWNGTRDASVDSPICIQNNPYTRNKNVEGSEDCLYLNVYTPQISTNEKQLLPVMVFFHGGGWMTGSGNKLFYGPERLMDRDVVYVGMNYRLGLLGMFSTEDEVAPGNFALKDQNKGLQWIKNNIEYFGGNPNSVTIFGQSAGGASVHYHMLSPKSRGLFHRAISHSGTALCVWANAIPKMTEKRRETFAKAMDCPTNDNFALVQCLRSKKAEEIIAADIHLYDWDYDPMIPFKPIVEMEHEDAFLTEDPRKLIRDGNFYHVPWMLGMNSKEGALRSANLVGYPELCHELESNFEKLAPVTFDYQYSDNVDSITQKIKKFYFNNENVICNESISALTDVYSDAYFTSGIDETVRLHLKQSKEPMYFYYFDFNGRNSFSKIFGDLKTDYGGTCHVDELIYIFNLGLFTDPLDKTEQNISSKLLTLWTNFASSGNPNEPQATGEDYWIPISSAETLQHLRIRNSMSMENHLLDKRRKLWHNLPLWHTQMKTNIVDEHNEL